MPSVISCNIPSSHYNLYYTRRTGHVLDGEYQSFYVCCESETLSIAYTILFLEMNGVNPDLRSGLTEFSAKPRFPTPLDSSNISVTLIGLSHNSFQPVDQSSQKIL